MARKFTTLPSNTQLYWTCEHCGSPHPWPQERARRFCDQLCRSHSEDSKCHMYGCERQAVSLFYCELHEIDPRDYGVTQKRRIPHYFVWVAMLNRCYNPDCKEYKYYGARSISVCQEWRDSFDAYFRYIEALPRIAGNRLSIDRIDNDGNYEPGNVQWATQSMQLKSRRPRGQGFSKGYDERRKGLRD